MHKFLVQLIEANPPSQFMLEFQADIYRVMPEIAALHGRIQPPQWHPEGAVDEHIRQVMDCAVALGASDRERWGAFVHDLGKGVTPENDLPRHINHEALGVPLVRTLGERLDVAEEWINFGQLCAKEHLNCHRFLELRPHKQVDLIDRCGTNVASLALVSMADARGRGPDFALKPYPSRDAIVKAAEAINGVTRETPQKTRDAKAKILKEIFHG